MEAEIESLFKLFDENKSGGIDKDELIKTYQGLGYEIDDTRAMEMIRSVDKNNNNEIDLDEFKELMLPLMEKRLLE